MTTVVFLLAAALTVYSVCAAMNWCEDRARRRMLRGVARWKIEQRKRQSRALAGSYSSGMQFPQLLSERAGGELPAWVTVEAPPARPFLVGVADHPAVAPTTLTPGDAAATRSAAFTGLDPAGAGDSRTHVPASAGPPSWLRAPTRRQVCG